MEELSLFYPPGKASAEKELPEATFHDLSVDTLCEQLTKQDSERNIICRMMHRISGDPEVIRYRCDVFEDILRFPGLRDRMQKLLDRVDFLRTYGSFGKDSDASGIWDLMHRLDEMDEYIQCVEAIYACLNENDIQSEGLLSLKEYVRDLYEDNGFRELKEDIDNLRTDTSKIKSVTLGINLNDRYEPVETGVVSVNEKYFSKSNILSNFCDLMNRRDEINPDTEWDGSLSFRTALGSQDIGKSLDRTAAVATRVLPIGLAAVTDDSRADDVMRSLDRSLSALLSHTVKKLKTVLSKHVAVSTQAISALIPEFMFYIRFAEYTETLKAAGFTLCKPQIKDPDQRMMRAEGLYNYRLAQSFLEKGTPVSEMVANDLDFSADHRIYILTGANRGGKTTITQAVGLAFLLAQYGIYVPASSFVFSPADNIFTHYPADENQTMDLGRLGEESSRFRDIFIEATPNSLLLLNESFSTTSFEEGYFIARDVTRILCRLGVRTIYNTHLHKLAMEIDAINKETGGRDCAASLIVETEDGSRRSYRVSVAPPPGKSYAQDIAEKYGVTYELLAKEKNLRG